MNKNEMNEKELEHISGGKYDPGFRPHLDGCKDFGDECEGALECLGTITWGNYLDEKIPDPTSVDDTFNYNGKIWKPVFAHCGWHQVEVIWKDPDGNYLVPTGIEMNGM